MSKFQKQQALTRVFVWRTPGTSCYHLRQNERINDAQA
jgi:hypothetical protein